MNDPTTLHQAAEQAALLLQNYGLPKTTGELYLSLLYEGRLVAQLLYTTSGMFLLENALERLYKQGIVAKEVDEKCVLRWLWIGPALDASDDNEVPEAPPQDADLEIVLEAVRKLAIRKRPDGLYTRVDALASETEELSDRLHYVFARLIELRDELELTEKQNA